MINANIIMFSRTMVNDYRWIYIDESLQKEEKRIILNDYSEFEKNVEEYTKGPHLVVRYFENKVVMYYFLDTKKCDQNSREIYGLLGCVFTSKDYQIVYELIKYVCCYFYYHITDLLEKNLENISERFEEEKSSIDVNLDIIIEKFKQDGLFYSSTLAIGSFIDKNINHSFIIKGNIINKIEDNEVSELSKKQDEQIKDEVTEKEGLAETNKEGNSICKSVNSFLSNFMPRAKKDDKKE